MHLVDALHLDETRCIGVLGKHDSLAHGNTTTIGIGAEHMLHKGLVDDTVVVGINGAGGTKEGNSAAIVVVHGQLAKVLFLSVEGHDIARGGNPQGQVQGHALGEELLLDGLLVGHDIDGAMAGVVHHQSTTLHLLTNELLYLGIAIACGGGLAGIGVPIDLLLVERGIIGSHDLCHSLSILHVAVVVAIVTQDADGVLPRGSMVVGAIVNNLIDHGRGLSQRTG